MVGTNDTGEGLVAGSESQTLNPVEVEKNAGSLLSTIAIMVVGSAIGGVIGSGILAILH